MAQLDHYWIQLEYLWLNVNDYWRSNPVSARDLAVVRSTFGGESGR
jgi:hypothetical protein